MAELFTASLSLPTAMIERVKAAVGPDALMAPNGMMAAAATWTARDGLPGFAMSAGEGTWPPVRRGGTPMMFKGQWLAGFTWAVSGPTSMRITTTGKPANIVRLLNDGTDVALGGPIKPKAASHTAIRDGKSITVKNYLHFKIGDRWMQKLSVTIPPRRWNRWTETLRAGAVKAATMAMNRMLKGGA